MPVTSNANTKYQVDFDVDAYLEENDPATTAAKQKKYAHKCVRKILDWLVEEGRRVDVAEANEDLDTLYADYIGKLRRDKPLSRSELEDLNDYYAKYSDNGDA